MNKPKAAKAANKPSRESSRFPGRIRRRIDCPETGRTKQSFKDECDINNIVNRYAKTGIIPRQNPTPGAYIDAPEIDLQTGLNLGLKIDDFLSQFPTEIEAKIRQNPELLEKYIEIAAKGSESPADATSEKSPAGLSKNADRALDAKSDSDSESVSNDRREKTSDQP